MENMRKIILVSWFLCLTILFADTMLYAIENAGQIKGQVKNLQTGTPIPNANIIVDGTILGAATDKDGFFFIKNIKAGSYHLICSVIGYRKETVSIQVKPGGITTITFQLKPTAIPMDNLVVTASKYQRAIEDIPVRIELIKPEDLAVRNVTNLNEALRYVPGVQMAGNNISIRGSSGFSYGVGTRTLVLLDGVPFLSGDENKVNFEAIPVSEIKQVEVMKGAGSALYGSSAMAGVINIITQKPPVDSAQLDVSLYSGFYDQPSYQQWRWTNSRRTFQGTQLSYRKNFSGVSSILSFNYRRNEHFKQDADYSNYNFYGKFNFDLNHNNHWRIETGLLKREVGGFLFWKDIDHALLPGNEPEDSYTRTNSNIFYIQSNMTQTVNSKFYYQFRLNYTGTHIKDIASPLPGRNPEIVGMFRSSEAKTYGHEMQFTYQYDADHNAVLGWDAYLNKVKSIQFGDQSSLKGSLYAQYSCYLTSKLKLDIGGRWDVERVENYSTASQFNPKIGMNYQLTDFSHLRFSAGRGFRAPSIAERFVSTLVNQMKVLPNPDLKPEKNFTLDIGYLQDISSFARIDINYFFNDYQDLIDPTLQSNELAVRFQNITRARIQGIEINQNLSLFDQQLQLITGYTYIHTQDLSKLVHGAENPDYGKDLKYRPNHLLYSRAIFHWKNWISGVDFRYISKAKRVDRVTNIPDITKQVPAYVTDIQFGYSGSNMSLMFIVNNLFQYYYLISPGSLGELRNYRIQFRWNYR